MDASTFDFDLLATHLRNEMQDKDLSIRAAASEIGCSPATLSRLLQGDEAPNRPDSVNLIRAVSWLKKSLADFESGKRKKATTLAEVEVHLRALSGLTKPQTEALVALVKASYDAAHKLRAKKS